MEKSKVKVGDVFNINGERVEVRVAKKGCVECIFLSNCKNPPGEKIMPCFSYEREDGESVYYKKVK